MIKMLLGIPTCPVGVPGCKRQLCFQVQHFFRQQMMAEIISMLAPTEDTGLEFVDVFIMNK